MADTAHINKGILLGLCLLGDGLGRITAHQLFLSEFSQSSLVQDLTCRGQGFLAFIQEKVCLFRKGLDPGEPDPTRASR